MPIRAAVPGDEATLRRLRLAAMLDAPAAFGSNHQRELARSDGDWARWIASSPTFFWEEPSGEAVGLVAAVPERDDARVVNLLSMWVAPQHRGVGAADALVSAVLAFAAARGAALVRLAVERENRRARRSYERNGFRVTGRESHGVRPGMVEVEMERVL